METGGWIQNVMEKITRKIFSVGLLVDFAVFFAAICQQHLKTRVRKVKKEMTIICQICMPLT